MRNDAGREVQGGRRLRTLVRTFLPLILLAGFLANNLLLILSSETYPTGDSAYYVNLSFRFHRLLRDEGWADAMRFAFRTPYPPPLMTILPAPFYSLFGKGYLQAKGIEPLFCTILFLSLFALTNRLWGYGVAIISALMLASIPATLWYSKVFLLDLPAASMLVLFIHALVSSDYFEKRGYSLVAGLALGLGALIKSNFFVFVLPPLIFAMVRLFLDLSNKGEKRGMISWLLPLCAIPAASILLYYTLPDSPYGRGAAFASSLSGIILIPFSGAVIRFVPYRRPKNLLLSLSLAGIIALPYYILNTGDIFNMLRTSTVSTDFIPGGARWSLTYYLGSMYRMLLPPFFLLSLTGLLLSLTRDSSRRKNTVLIVTLVAGYLLMCLIRQKQDRYIYPLFPVMAIIATSWIGWIRAGWLKYPVICIHIILSLLQFSAFDLYHFAIPDRHPLPYPFPPVEYGPAPPSRRDAWMMKEMMDDVMELSGRKAEKVVVFLEESQDISFLDFHYIKELHEFPFDFTVIDFNSPLPGYPVYGIFVFNPDRGSVAREAFGYLGKEPYSEYDLPAGYRGYVLAVVEDDSRR